MSEFSANWEGTQGNQSDTIAEKLHFKFLVLGGGNAAGYAAKTFVEQFSPKGSLQLNLDQISQQPVTSFGKAQQNKDGSLFAIISAENTVPYERPALSKAYLNPPGSKVQLRLPNFNTCVGTKNPNQSEAWYTENNITLLLGYEAVDFDAETQTLICDRRSDRKLISVTYEKLIVATGARPLFTAVFEKASILDNIFVLRNEVDAQGIVSGLSANKGKHVVVIGGGYIGMECAAAFAGWDVQVTMIFPEKNLLQRLFTPEISAWYEKYFTEKKGIKIMKGLKVTKFIGEEGKVQFAELETGEQIACDMVLIGIGAVLNIDIFTSQLELASSHVNGVVVNEHMKTSDPNVYAVGDIAAVPFERGFKRFEHVDHCRKTADIAIKNMLIEAHNSVVDDGTANLKTSPKALVKHTYLPYYYSRLFEYTDSPVVFNFYGLTSYQLKGLSIVHFGDFGTLDLTPRGAFWIDKNRHVVGGIVCCGSADNYAELKEIVINRRRISSADSEGVKKLLSSL